jgi:hypothetical protein
VQKQNVEHARDLPGHLSLDLRNVFGPEFLSTRPEVISRRRVRDPHVDPQHPTGTAPLNTPVNHVTEFGWVSRREAAAATRFVRYPGERQATAMPKKVGYKAVGEAFDQTLPIGRAGQIA